MAFPLLILSDLTPSCAATRCNSNIAADEDKDDDEPPQLVSGGFEGGDTMAAMCIERMELSRTYCNLLGARAGSGQRSSSQLRGTLYHSGS
jgi:hypothetical protein